MFASGVLLASLAAPRGLCLAAPRGLCLAAPRGLCSPARFTALPGRVRAGNRTARAPAWHRHGVGGRNRAQVLAAFAFNATEARFALRAALAGTAALDDLQRTARPASDANRDPEPACNAHPARLSDAWVTGPRGVQVAHSTTASTAPSSTAWPSWQRTSETLPATGASTGISIFIDSKITTESPTATASPTCFSIFHTVPVMCAVMLVATI